METFELLWNGILNAVQLEHLLCAIVGGIIGILVGTLPGMGSSSGCALMLPLTYKLEPTSAIILLGALYFGNMFGGAISAILINIPGDSPAVMTAVDGYKLTQNGKAGKALFAAFFSSTLGGLVGVIMLTFMGRWLTVIGLAFGPAEMTLLIVLAMTSIAWALGESPIKGVISTCIGLAMALIGVDIISGQNRMTFGVVNLMSGLEFVPVVIGLFGFSQVINTIAESGCRERKVVLNNVKMRECLLDKDEWIPCTFAAIRSSVIGFFVGVLPGSGATLATLISYLTAKRVGKNREKIGTGIAEGVMVAESADNAASVGSFAPLFSLGIPGSGTSAILLGGLMMWGLQPGPLFMTQQSELAWGMIGSMYVSDIAISVICISMLPVLVNILKIPNKLLIPLILTICIVGAYSIGNNIFNVYVMMIMGILGYFLLKYDFPLAPLTLAMVLAPRLETSLRQGFLIANGSIGSFISSNLAISLAASIVVFVVMPIVVKKLTAKR